MKRAFTIAALVLTFVVLGSLLFLKLHGFEIVITQAQIDAALKERFPLRKPFLIFFELVYSNPEVTLLPDVQRVRVGLDAEVNTKIRGQTKKFGGSATLTGRVNYFRETQEFYLTELQFERLAIDDIPPEHLQAVKDFAAKAAEEYVRRCPIYRLKASEGRTDIATSWRGVIKDVQVRDREVVVKIRL